MPKYIRDKDLAERYSVARSTIWRWAASGVFPQPVKLAIGCTRWKIEDIEEHDAQINSSGERTAAA